MKYAYANKIFKAAVNSMAASSKNIQEKVGDALNNHLILLETEDLPEEIRSKFSYVFQRLTRCEAIGDKGSIQATIEQMSTEEATEIAEDIAFMADILNSKLSDL